MPSDFMVFEVSEQPQEEEDEDQSTSTLDASTKWDVNHRWMKTAPVAFSEMMKTASPCDAEVNIGYIKAWPEITLDDMLLIKNPQDIRGHT